MVTFAAGDADRLDLRLVLALDVVPHRQRAEADHPSSVRLGEMPPVVPRDVPVRRLRRVGVHEVGQQGLGEILGVDLSGGSVSQGCRGRAA